MNIQEKLSVAPMDKEVLFWIWLYSTTFFIILVTSNAHFKDSNCPKENFDESDILIG